MNSIRVKNLRSIEDSGEIELRPISILVGANSSGKSSFLRVFPLLRQSAETRTGSGLLLNEPYVDFGIFPIALRNGANPPEIGFEFGFSISGEPTSSYQYGPSALIRDAIPIKISVAFARKNQDSRYSFLRRLGLRFGNVDWSDTIELEATEDGGIGSLTINGGAFVTEISKLRLRSGRGLVPTLVDQGSGTDAESVFVRDEATRLNAFTDSLLGATDNIFHGRTLKETRINILRAIRYGSPSQMLDRTRKVTDNGSWNSAAERWNLENPAFVRLRNLLIGDSLGELLNRISSELNRFSRYVQYFEPIRARVQRDYVSRDIQVESIEPDGKNLAMFITSLGYEEKRSLQEWLLKTFGFSVSAVAVADGARVSLRLKEAKTGVEQNLADMGFGYSQMLPLLVQIWALTVRLSMTNEEVGARRYWELRRFQQDIPRFGYLIAIEQPELHLHPALQSRFADILVQTINAAKETKIPVKFVVETHSQALINRLGYLVERKVAEKSDCQVLLFERGVAGGDSVVSVIRKSEFDESGVLLDWPFGFLSPTASEEPMGSKSSALPDD